MSLDLGAVIGRVVLEDVEFQRTYVRVVRQMSTLGESASRAAGGTATLDESLAAVSSTASKAATGLGQTAKAATQTAAAEQRAAAAAQRQAAAVAEVSSVMTRYAGASAKVQQSALRETAAQQRLTAARAEGGSAAAKQAAATARLAGAQASSIGSTERLAAAQAGTAAAGLARLRTGMAGTVAMAGQLGLIVGAFEAVKKAIDITKEANDFQRMMVQIQTNADVTAAEVRKASGALLDLAGPVAASPEKLAVAFYHAKSVGLDYAKALNTTKIAAEGARVGHADLEETMNALTSTVASGIPGVDNMSSAMGQLIAIVGTGDMKLSDLNEALGSGILTVVKGYGLSLTDVGAALATFGDNNIRGANAATMLRMAVQSMAVPMVGGRKRLLQLGLSASALAKDMQTGGLNKAILDLKAHLDGAGVGAKQVGAVLTEVFGKRAGPGIAVLVGQTDRLESKFRVLRDSGASFADKWKATTQTAAFALSSLGHGAEAAGIELTAKLGPSIAYVARLLISTLRGALQIASDAVRPFAAAWRVLAPVLSAAGHALADVGHFLHPLAGPLKTVTAAVLTLWLAFKAFAIAKIAILAVSGAFTTMAANAASSATTAGMGLATMSRGAMLARTSMVVAAAGIALVSYGLQQNAQRAAEAKARVEAYTEALRQSKGAIDGQVQALVIQRLATDGAYDAARKYGLSLSDVTDAALGNKAAQLRLVNASKGNFDAMNNVALAAAREGGALNIAKQHLKDTADQTDHATGAAGKHAAAVKIDTRVVQYNIDAHGRLVHSMVKAGSALDNTSSAMARQTVASNILKNAIDALNGVNLSVEQTQDQLNISLGQLRHGTSLYKNANGHVVRSLNQSTVAGATNRQMLVGIIQNAKDAAQATADHARAAGKSLPAALRIGNRALKSNEDKIRAAAHAAGLNKGEVNALIRSIGKLAVIKANPKIDANTKPARDKAAAIQKTIDAIKQGKVPALTANPAQARAVLDDLHTQLANLHDKNVKITIDTYNRTHKVKAQAAGSGPGGIPEGFSSINERGPELLYKRGSRVDVIPNAASRSIIAATGMVAPGFAGGTKANPSAVTSAIGAVGQAPAGPQIDLSQVGIGRVNAQIAHAVAVLRTQIANGLSAKATTAARAEIKHLRHEANAALKDLRVTIRGADLRAIRAAFSGSAADLRGAFATLIADARRAGMTPAQIRHIERTRTTLLRQQGRLADKREARTAARATLGDMRQFQAGAISTLAGFDPTQFGSIGSLAKGLGAGATRNTGLAGEISKLTGEGLNKNFLSGLIANGQTSVIDMLSRGSKADILNTNKAIGAFDTSATAVGQAATVQQYGKSIADQSALVDRQSASIDSLIAEMRRETNHVTVVKVGEKEIARATSKTLAKRLHHRRGRG